jgi:Predicted kinase
MGWEGTVRYAPQGPAIRRLEWMLDGLWGDEAWGHDVAEALAPEYTVRVAPDEFARRMRARSTSYAPLGVVGVEATGHTARARIRHVNGQVDVLGCEVETEPPHRITATWLAGQVPAGTTARLPTDFAGYDIPRCAGRSMVVFSGVPGSGKSTLADAVGARLHVPVFAIDWLLGALTPYGGRHLDGLAGIGYEQLTTLAVRQFALGQSVILDAPVEDPATRGRWRSLASRVGARFKVITCVCADPNVHRTRVEGRVRGIPGWHDAGDWADVSRRLGRFTPWEGDVLTVDTTRHHQHNVDLVLTYLSH